MSIWKILGGIAIGVGAVAAAPFTGGGSVLAGASLVTSLAGAGAITAAVAAGAIGGAVGASMGDSEENARKEGIRDGRQQALAETAQRLQLLEQNLSRALSKLRESSQHFKVIIALQAVAIAVANCDGVICDSEKKDIELFVNGVSSSSLPNEVKVKVADLYKNPPNIKEAFILATESGVEMSVFDEIVAFVMTSDEVIHPLENDFVQAWNRLKAA